MPQIARVVDQHRAPKTSRLVLDIGYVGSVGRQTPSSWRLVGDVFGLDTRVEGPLDGCRRPHPTPPRTTMMMTFRSWVIDGKPAGVVALSTCPMPGPCHPRIKCLVQTSLGSIRTVAPRSHSALDTKDRLGLNTQQGHFKPVITCPL